MGDFANVGRMSQGGSDKTWSRTEVECTELPFQQCLQGHRKDTEDFLRFDPWKSWLHGQVYRWDVAWGKIATEVSHPFCWASKPCQAQSDQLFQFGWDWRVSQDKGLLGLNQKVPRHTGQAGHPSKTVEHAVHHFIMEVHYFIIIEVILNLMRGMFPFLDMENEPQRWWIIHPKAWPVELGFSPRPLQLLCPWPPVLLGQTDTQLEWTALLLTQCYMLPPQGKSSLPGLLLILASEESFTWSENSPGPSAKPKAGRIQLARHPERRANRDRPHVEEELHQTSCGHFPKWKSLPPSAGGFWISRLSGVPGMRFR